MEAVTIVTIKNKIPLFKGEEAANAIELIELEEVGYELVAGKSLYQIGDKAVLIQPDYCVSDTPLFETFVRPNGDESKSMLGKVDGLPRRIRAKKFNLSKIPNGDPVYSNGILLPYNEVVSHIGSVILENVDLTSKLGITKYEESEYTSKGGIKVGGTLKFPNGIYKTDEENVNNLWNHLENKIGYPITLVGTEKIDGSSITIGITPEIPEGFICSRNMRKKLTISKWLGNYRKPTVWEWIKSLFGITPDLKKLEEVVNDDDFVRYGLPYLRVMQEMGITNLILRGELNGGKLKGSGNKNNPASKLSANIKFFGMDRINEIGQSEKLPYVLLNRTNQKVCFDMVKEVFNKTFNSKEEILQECNQYFKENMIEGIVIRTLDSKFSAKVMNLEYDSKK